MGYMEQALSLARVALGNTSPNPAVGAVIVKDNKVVGQGYTQPAGYDHAEVVALKQAKDRAKGAVLFVTLEPCCHYGRRPPCTRAVIAAGISEVHMAMIDPNPKVSGKGKAELEQAGIKTYVGEHAAEARDINEAYIKYITTGMPFVTTKFAMSLDGKTATRTGDSRWISGEESRQYVHYLRYTSDAVLAGVDTVLVDNPHLTARCCGGRGGTAKKQPLRVIVDSRGRSPATANVFSEPGKTLLALGNSVESDQIAAFTKAGAEVLALPLKEGLVDMESLLKALGKREITSVLVESGGVLSGSLFDLGLVDKVLAFIAPLIVGGSQARTAIAGKGVERIADAIRLKRVKVERFGGDVMVSGYVRE